MTARTGPFRARQTLAALPAPDRAAVIVRTLRVADPDEADTLAVDLIEALQALDEDPGHSTRILEFFQRFGLVGMVPAAWRADLDARTGVDARLAAAAALAERWDDYTTPTRRLAAAALGPIWTEALRRAAADLAINASATTGIANPEADPDGHAIAGIIAAACDGQTSPDPGACAALLNHPLAGVSEAAAIALGRLTAAARAAAGDPLPAATLDTITDGRGPTAARSDLSPSDLESALEQAVRTVDDHRQRTVLAAAVAHLVGPLADAETIDRWLGGKAGAEPGGRELAAAFRRAAGADIRLAAWRWLDGTAADAVMLERVGHAHNRAEHEALLEHAHLVLRPHRLRRSRPLLAAPASASAALPDDAAVRALGERARLGLVRLIEKLMPEGPPRATRLTLRLSDASDAVRLMACSAAGPTDLADWCFDRAPVVARSAALRWGATGVSHRRAVPGDADAARLAFARTLERSPHAAVRTIAGDAAAAIDVWRVDGRAGSLLLRRWHAAEPDRAVAALRDRVIDGPAATRIAAIRLADRAGLADRIGAELASCAGLSAVETESGERIAATAVRALGRVTGTAARRAVVESLAATDARVRANAVEAIGTAGDDAYASLVELRRDNGHRVRANALRVMLAGGPGFGGAHLEAKPGRVFDPAAVESLTEMLTDDRAEHRLAAMWLAERTLCGGGAARFGEAFDPLARRVAAIAREDADSSVRTRGVRCASRLLAEVRTVGVEAGAAA